MLRTDVFSTSNKLVNSIVHGPIMILEILRIYDESKTNKEQGNANVIRFVNESPRELKEDTKTILKMRGFTPEQIPKLS